MSMPELYNGALCVEELLSKWYKSCLSINNGAFSSFVGIVREEDGIEALSFDIYRPLLYRWFEEWQQSAKTKNALLYMAHSIGDVAIHESSFAAAVISPKRRVALELIDEFVEDFKAKAPIWKYDVIGGARHYAAARSTALAASGLLA